MRCLYCGERIIPNISWGRLFSREKEDVLCSLCEMKLVPLEGECCARCSRPLMGLAEELRKGEFCYDCVRWEDDEEWRGSLTCNGSLYVYGDFMNELISRYKFRGDYVLAKVFRESILTKLKNIDYDLVVPIPLSAERLYERGFNQAEAIVRMAGLSPTAALKRVHTEKQSKKSREERIRLTGIFLTTDLDIIGKNILLVDDIYTTGSTLVHASKVLKISGAVNITSITIAR